MSDAEHYTDDGKVICKECGKAFQSIAVTHLRSKHEMELESYKTKYPGAPLVSKTFASRMLAKSKYRDTTISRDESKVETKIEVLDEPSNDDLFAPISNEEIVKKVKEKESKKVKEPKPLIDLPPIHQCREDMFNILSKSYAKVVKNHVIEKFNSTGHAEYSYITDMVDLETKTIFDFPDTFWHNTERAYDRLKFHKLKQDGWTIITIDSELPNLNDIKKVIDIVM